MATLQAKPEAGDTVGQMNYRIERLTARLARIDFCLKRAADNKSDVDVEAFAAEKEMREAELNFLTKKKAVADASA